MMSCCTPAAYHFRYFFPGCSAFWPLYPFICMRTPATGPHIRRIIITYSVSPLIRMKFISIRVSHCLEQRFFAPLECCCCGGLCQRVATLVLWRRESHRRNIYLSHCSLLLLSQSPFAHYLVSFAWR